MNRILALTLVLTHALLNHPREVPSLLRRRDQRGGGSSTVETLIILGVIVALAIAVGVLVTAYVKGKMPTT